MRVWSMRLPLWIVRRLPLWWRVRRIRRLVRRIPQQLRRLEDADAVLAVRAKVGK